SGKRSNERREHSHFRKLEGAVNFDDAPSALRWNARGHAGLFDHDGEFIAGARDRKKRALRGPSGNVRAGGESDNGKIFWQKRELKAPQRKCHRVRGGS